jgi:hypothetical protein
MQPAIRARVLSSITTTAPGASLHISRFLRSLGACVLGAYGTNYKFTDTIERVVSWRNSFSWKSLVEKRRLSVACRKRDRYTEYLEGSVQENHLL